MSAFGPQADWLCNIQARPRPEVVVGTRRVTAAYRVLGREEPVQVIAGYERRNLLIAPVIRLVLSRLLGWRYHSCEGDRRRLVTQLPFIAFRPAAATGLIKARTVPGETRSRIARAQAWWVLTRKPLSI